MRFKNYLVFFITWILMTVPTFELVFSQENSENLNQLRASFTSLVEFVEGRYSSRFDGNQSYLGAIKSANTGIQSSNNSNIDEMTRINSLVLKTIEFMSRLSNLLLTPDEKSELSKKYDEMKSEHDERMANSARVIEMISTTPGNNTIIPSEATNR